MTVMGYGKIMVGYKQIFNNNIITGKKSTYAQAKI